MVRQFAEAIGWHFKYKYLFHALNRKLLLLKYLLPICSPGNPAPLFYFLAPALILYACHKSNAINKIAHIIYCLCAWANNRESQNLTFIYFRSKRYCQYCHHFRLQFHCFLAFAINLRAGFILPENIFPFASNCFANCFSCNCS